MSGLSLFALRAKFCPARKTKPALPKQNGSVSWCALLDLNQRPSDYESPALTN